MYIGMCADVYMDSCADAYIDACIDMCIDRCVYGHVHRCVHRDVYRHVIGKVISGGAGDCLIRVWDLGSMEALMELSGHAEQAITI